MILLLEGAMKISVVIAIGLVAIAVLRHQSAALRHWVLATALAAALATPLLTRVAPSWSFPAMAPVSEAQPAATPNRQGRVDISTTFAESAPTTPAPDPRDFTLAVLAIWGAGLTLNLAALMLGFWRLRTIARRAAVVHDGPWADAVRELSTHFGLRTPVRLLQSDQPAVLVTWGFVTPKVMLPVDAPSWERDRIRVVLAHELAHVQRHDWIVQVASELLRISCWFNPLVWLATTRLRLESERACDDAVVNLGVRGDDYAEHLLELARQFGRAHHVPYPAVAIVPRPSSLQRRVTAMLNPHLSRRPISRQVRVATLIAVLAAVVPIALFAQNRFSTVTGSIVDPSDAALPGVTVVAVDTTRGARHEIQTNRTGRFEMVGLPDGPYVLEVSLPGFQSVSEKFTLDGQDVQRDISLQLGSLSETIAVTRGGNPPTYEGQRYSLPRATCGPASAQAAAGAVRIGGQIRQPVKLRHVSPIYPEGVTGGVVRMDAVIGLDGLVQETKVTNDAPASLAQAAVDAVRQWEFSPTLLNCEAVPVRMSVSVSFN